MLVSLTSVLRHFLRQNLRHFGGFFVSSELVERIFWLQSSKVESGPRTEAEAASSRASKPTFGTSKKKSKVVKLVREKVRKVLEGLLFN